jgi:hypothetical protein
MPEMREAPAAALAKWPQNRETANDWRFSKINS